MMYVLVTVFSMQYSNFSLLQFYAGMNIATLHNTSRPNKTHENEQAIIDKWTFFFKFQTGILYIGTND